MGFVYRYSSRISFQVDVKYLKGKLQSATDVDVTGIDCSSRFIVAL
ncbi:MAG: hypothetical protein ABIL68_07480 [bacterium]